VKHAVLLLFAALCIALTACSGAGSGAGAILPAAQKTAPARAMAHASFVVHVPAKTSTTSSKPQYVSPSTAQISISVNGAAATVSPLNPTASGCTAGSSGFTCTVNVAAPVGSDAFAVSLLDADNTVLSSITIDETVVSGTSNTFGIVLDGVIASLTIALATSAPPANGQAQQIALTVNGIDADGNTIMGPGNYSSPIQITDSDTSGITTLSASGSSPATTLSITAPGTAVTVNYSGAALPGGATFTASVPGTSVQQQSVTLTPSSSTSSTTISLAITGTPYAIAYSVGTSGTWTALGTGATSFTLTGTTAYGVAYACYSTGFIYFLQATAADLSTVPIACGLTNATLALTFAFSNNALCPQAAIVDVDDLGDDFAGCSSTAANDVTLYPEAQDVFAMAETSGGTLLAVKTLQGQAVPGSATATFATSDAVGTTPAPVIAQTPAATSYATTQVYFGQFNNWAVPLYSSSASEDTSAQTVASGDIGSNDSYLTMGAAWLSGPGNAYAVVSETIGTSIPSSISLPTAYNASATQSTTPALATTYTWASSPSGNVTGYYVGGSWYGEGFTTQLRGIVTSKFLGSATSYTMPAIDATGFPVTVATGSTEYSWSDEAFSIPAALFAQLPYSGLSPSQTIEGLPAGGPQQGSMLLAEAAGSFTTPSVDKKKR
jgi:hypothetical protein